MEMFNFNDLSPLVDHDELANHFIQHFTATQMTKRNRKTHQHGHVNEGFDEKPICEQQVLLGSGTRDFIRTMDQTDIHASDSQCITTVSVISGFIVKDKHMNNDDLSCGESLPGTFSNNFMVDQRDSGAEYFSNKCTNGHIRTRKSKKRNLKEEYKYMPHADPTHAFYSALCIDSNLGIPLQAGLC